MSRRYADRLRERAILSTEDLRAYVPSVFATEPRSDVSERYAFVPTINVIERIQEVGFVPVSAGQSTARVGNSVYKKHLVRFRLKQYAEAPEALTPEVLLINSHDRTSTFQLMAGIFRVICSNGLIAWDQKYGQFRFRHSGDAAERIVNSVDSVMEIAKSAIERASDLSKITLTQAQQVEFAREAAKLRFKDAEDMTLVNGLLIPKRLEESNPDRLELPKSDLFTTLNVVQENIMRGKIQRTLASGRKSSTHAVNSVQADLAINKGIWALAEKFATEVA